MDLGGAAGLGHGALGLFHGGQRSAPALATLEACVRVRARICVHACACACVG